MTIPTLPAAAARRALARAVIVRPGDVTGGEIRRLFGPGADLKVRRAPLCYLPDTNRPGRTYCDAATAHLQSGQVAVVEVAYHLPTSLLEWVAAGALRAAEQAGRERHTARCHHHAGCRTLTIALDTSGGLDADLRALVADVEADNNNDEGARVATNDDGAGVDRRITARACGWILHEGGSLRDAGQLARWARNAWWANRLGLPGARSRGVIVAADGTLLAETRRHGHGPGPYTQHVVLADMLRLTGGEYPTEIGIAMGRIRQAIGQPVAHARFSELCEGPGL
ncbi:hypothetical protein [Actinomyces qiguomingii]|uniref:hypothetical protein n=1 Tax=Actinomyces qiguomingii TaxID=2057800 RepID=UPI000CA00D30|nr:hypothetical protein [Actinomyces qiguomingii]